MLDRNLIAPYVRLATHSVILPPWIIGERVIFDYEIIFVKDGSCRLRCGDTEYLCRKNDVVFLRPGVRHTLIISDEPFHQPHIHFDVVYDADRSKRTPISFKAPEDMTPEERSLIREDVLADCPIPCIFTPRDPDAFQTLFFSVVNAHGDERRVLSQRGELMLLLNLILDQFDGGHPQPDRDGDMLMGVVRDYIDAHYMHPLSLDFLAEVFGLNKFTMMRRFKAAFHTNIMRYYNEKRLEAAKSMLSDTNLSVKAIGEALGFSDAYSFSRFFKTHTGVSPIGMRDVL